MFKTEAIKPLILLKENKLFVLPVFSKTLMPTWMDFLVSKLPDKSSPAVISPKVLINAKRDKSLPVKINAASLQQNKNYSVGFGFSPWGD